MKNLPIVNKPKRIQAVQRAMAILEAIAANHQGMRLQDLAAQVGLTPGAVHHIVDTLAAEGYVVRGTQPVVYRIGPGLISLAARGQRDLFRIRVDAEHLALAARLPEANVVYCEAVGLEFRMLRQVRPERPGILEALPDSLTTPYTSAASLVHFAYWPQERVLDYKAQRPFVVHGRGMWEDEDAFDAAVADVRRTGYAVVPLEAPRNVRLGVPVLRPDGALVGSFTLSAYGLTSSAVVKRRCIREGRSATRRLQDTKESAHV